MSTTKHPSRAKWTRRKNLDKPHGQLNRAPLVPENILKRNKAYCRVDSRFRAAARLLQCFWLQDHNIPTGSYSYRIGDDDIITEFGSILSPEAADAGKNFINNDVYHLVLRELLLREDGAAYDEERLFANALSSQPLTFNLLAGLSLDLGRATRVFSSIFPDFVNCVDRIAFETAPFPRRDPRALHDGTAFDAAILCTAPDGANVTIFVETKYSELMGPAARPRERYDTASHQVRLYTDPDDPLLRSTALEQFWREANLAQLAVDAEITSRAIFMVIAPKLNRRVQTAIRAFESLLIPAEDQDANRIAFRSITLEAMIDAIHEAGDSVTSRQLWARYCDFTRVYDACYQELTSPPPSEEPSFVQIAERLPASVTSEATPRETV